MSSFLRFLQILTMTLWVGGIAFFAFAVAPVAFQNLPNFHEAGIVVRGTILVLHRIGFVCGIVFLASILALRRQIGRRSCLAQTALASLMLLLTLISHAKVLPAMETDRLATGGIVEEVSNDDPHRIDFDRLHILSERLEGTVLFLGLAILVAMAIDRSSTAESA